MASKGGGLGDKVGLGIVIGVMAFLWLLYFISPGYADFVNKWS